MTIFVAGIHGAGKTFATKDACQKLGLVHATASQLIRAERGQASWNASKIVSDLDMNQIALVKATERIRDRGETLVLDGHFVLRRGPGDHELLSVDVFRSLKCSAVLLIRSPLTVVLDRLRARQDMTWSEVELENFSKAEDAHGAEVASTLGIPFTILDAPSTKDVEDWLKLHSQSRRAPIAEQ